MIPVLAVNDIARAQDTLAGQFGFRSLGPGRMAVGTASIVIVPIGAPPDGLIVLPLDHVAFQVPDADRACRTFLDKGAQPDPHFTPDGPREIAAFWEHGVRFIFFHGPDGAPFEFCAKNAVSPPSDICHSHFAIRAADLDMAEAQIEALGARRIAHHQLAGGLRPVNVRFLQGGSDIFELFDEAPVVVRSDQSGWIGLLPN